MPLFNHVRVASVTLVEPPEVRTSDAIEADLAELYTRLRLPPGRLELMTGIRERRFWTRGSRSNDVAARAGRRALDESGIDPSRIGALIHASVCRDGLEPATAAYVHERLGLSPSCSIFDLTNACLGVLSAMTQVAAMIDQGWIDAGLIVSGEVAEPLHDATMRALRSEKHPTRPWLKRHFASLTIGSAAAAVVLARADGDSPPGKRLLGGAWRTDSGANRLCRADTGAAPAGDVAGPLMDTDSEALLHAGCALARDTWQDAKTVLDWTNDTPDHIFTHQVGRAHRQLTFEMLGLDLDKDYPTVDRFGNTGSAALPGAWALGVPGRPVKAGDKVALLGIGSGLSCLALGVEW